MIKISNKGMIVALSVFMIAFLCISIQSSMKHVSNKEAESFAADSLTSSRLYYLHEMETTRSTGESLINSLVSKGNTIVIFYASWCPPCQRMAPFFEELAAQIDDITFIKVNLDLYRSLFASYGLKTVPAILFFRDGKLIKKQPSSVSKDRLIELINEVYA